MNKYILTENTKLINNITLYQIKAIKSFSDISKGSLGGWIEKESNLSQELSAWVYGNAIVSGNARVSGNAGVFGNAIVYGNAIVSGNAIVYGNARVFENAIVYGNARVYENAWVYGNAWVSGNASTTPIVITGLRYNITICDNIMQIGCKYHN